MSPSPGSLVVFGIVVVGLVVGRWVVQLVAADYQRTLRRLGVVPGPSDGGAGPALPSPPSRR